MIRLSRPHGDGGAVIERAAILAEGTPAAAIEAWVVGHGGRPEAAAAAAHGTGLHGLRPQQPGLGGNRPPQRYVMPAAALSVVA